MCKILLFASVFIFLAITNARATYTQLCKMSYMWPEFEFQLSKRRYKLFKYRDATLGAPSGEMAIVFVPGNRGSYKQVRSFGSHISHLAVNQQTNIPHIYTLDLHEEWSALSGNIAQRQRIFVNSTLFTIAKRHGWNNLIIIAHSMGGVIVKSLPGLPVHLVISLATPQHPVLGPWDDSAQLNSIYKSPCPSFPLVSIGGGLADDQVAPHLTVDPCPTTLQLSSTAIVGSWTSVDHKAIMWCNALIERMARGVLQSQSPKVDLRWWKEFLTKASLPPPARISLESNPVVGELDQLYRHQALDFTLPMGCNLSFYSSHPILQVETISIPSPQQAAALEQIGRPRTFDDDLLPGVYYGFTSTPNHVMTATRADWTIVSCTNPSVHSLSLVFFKLLPWPYRLGTQSIELPSGIKHTVELPGLLSSIAVLHVSTSRSDFPILLVKNDGLADQEFFHYVNLAQGKTAKVSFFNTDNALQSLTFYTTSPVSVFISVSITSSVFHAVKTYVILLAMLSVPASYAPKFVLFGLLAIGRVTSAVRHAMDATWILSILWILALGFSKPFTYIPQRDQPVAKYYIPIVVFCGVVSSSLFPRTLSVLFRGLFSDQTMALMCLPGVIAWIQAKHYLTRPTFTEIMIGFTWSFMYNFHVFTKRSKWEPYIILACVLFQLEEYIFPTLSSFALITLLKK
jgi:hypothetical protein